MPHHARLPGDEPADDARVESLLAAAAAPCEPGPLPGEAAALAAFRASHLSTRRYFMHRTRAKVAAAAALGTGLLLTAGVGAAAAGSLPGAAQATASRMLAVVGVEVPGAVERSSPHANEGGRQSDAPAADAAGGTSSEPRADEPGSGPGATPKGSDVSDLAVSLDALGVEKGAEISSLASEGRSRAGRHGVDQEAADHRPDRVRGDGTDGHAGADDAGPEDGRPEGARPEDARPEGPPVDTPDRGGAETSDEVAGAAAGGDSAAAGEEGADDASDGHSSSGSGSRP